MTDLERDLYNEVARLNAALFDARMEASELRGRVVGMRFESEELKADNRDLVRRLSSPKIVERVTMGVKP